MDKQAYAIEMLNITKRFPGIIANDNITLQLKKARSMHCWERMEQGSQRL